ncbi:TVP38/TMEM64 family protein [Vallitalea okinawensis]|uniref:TVP38/TMEM64 family protein n=1 Tax=Vallitalea okinawensis TaxID=2078660 RepID=UPI000CFB7CB5|nr:VTT domain-containing protein [Vallitalea okinawensis]
MMSQIEENTIKKIGFIVISVFLINAMSVIIIGFYTGAFENSDTFTNYIEGFGILAPMIFTLYVVIRVLVPIIPTFIGYVGGVTMFGPINAFILLYIGNLLSSSLAFYLARRYGKKFVINIIGENNYNKCTKWTDKKKSFDLSFLAIVSLLLMPDDTLYYIGGLTKMSYKRFLLMVAIGKPWSLLMYCGLLESIF